MPIEFYLTSASLDLLLALGCTSDLSFSYGVYDAFLGPHHLQATRQGTPHMRGSWQHGSTSHGRYTFRIPVDRSSVTLIYCAMSSTRPRRSRNGRFLNSPTKSSYRATVMTVISRGDTLLLGEPQAFLPLALPRTIFGPSLFPWLWLPGIAVRYLFHHGWCIRTCWWYSANMMRLVSTLLLLATLSLFYDFVRICSCRSIRCWSQ